jgi:Leucine-rich repeat (LRR) protein
VMGNLKCMEHMNLSWCWNLRYLPRCFSELTSLLSLNLYNCSNLTWGHERPAHEENSRSDEHKLRLSDLCNMRQLRHLDIDCRKELSVPEQLMESFGEMRTLRLNMRKLEALPEGMKGMANLEILRLTVRDLQQLPSWISHFKSLRWLELSYCQNIRELPRLERMPQLRRLQIEHCSNLTELGSNFGSADAFPTLEELCFVGLDKLEELPALESGSMARLRVLKIIRCNNIRRLPQGVDRLSSLRILDLSHSTELIRGLSASQTETATSENWERNRRLPQHVQIYTHSRAQTTSLDCIH